MPRAAEPPSLNNAAARHIWLRAQRLDTGVPFGEGAACGGGGGRPSRLCADRHHQRDRALPSPHPVHPHPGLPARGPQAGAEPWTRACSNTGRTRCPMCRPRTSSFFLPAMKAHKRDGHKWFASVTPADTRKVMRLLRAGSADHPRHRRRRADREGAPLAEPQTVQAGAATRLLWRRGDDQRTRRHARRPTS